MSHLNDLIAALEADDVTQEAKDGAAQATGQDQGPDYSNTDDIFGVEPPGDAGDGGSAEGDPNGGGDDMGGDMGDGDDMGDDDLGGDEEMSDEDISDAQKKMVLRDNLIELYNIIKGDINQLTEYKFNTSPDNSTNTAEIVKNLNDLKKVISDTLTNDFKGLEYTTALTKYVSIKKVYDISIKMLYEHFDNLHTDEKKKDNISKKSTKKEEESEDSEDSPNITQY